jgi:hypothetical protein
MEYSVAWWELLGAGTQAWLVTYSHNDIPSPVADQVEAAGGKLFDATWTEADGESWRVRFLLPEDQLWIDAHARGE